MRLNYTKIVSIGLLVITSLVGCESKSNPKQTKNKPNIVLFFVDDLGWSDLGFRNPIFESPNINSLAKSGLSFEQAYIPTPTCSPSRATLLTGKHPVRLEMVRHIPGGKKNGFDQFGRGSIEYHLLPRDPAQFPSRNWLPLEHKTYAEALKTQGYYNMFLGKWHLGHESYHPNKQGFDKQIGTSNFGHPKSYYPPYFRQDSIFEDTKNTYLTDKLTNEAVCFIRNYKKENPFLLTFSYYSAHSPHEGRKDLVAYFEAKGLKGKFAHYAAMVKATDESVGRVMQAIKDAGKEKETIFIFLSDQGGYFENAPFRGGKMTETLFEGGARIPFFFYWDGVTSPNSKNDTPVQSTDLFPTLVEIAGGDTSIYQNLDGVSLLSTIKENKLLKERTLFGYRAYEDLYASVRDGDWKLLTYRSGKTELFNISKDVKEEYDLNTKMPDIVDKLKDKLIKWEKEMNVEKYSGMSLK
ncbi:sulfatase [Polaribacter tangerinus]|uniref:sulfatase n=1 Tax=Polaribacter tangerinus TaxID=1920034 RepID=UPI000B4B034C|nr:sulfatase [Polaribacter tangerinus]